MMTTILFFMALNSLLLYNPVKMSVFLLLMSSIIFFSCFLMTGHSWLPSIFYLLFMGGILVMFMILSSLSPNESSNKLMAPIMLMLLLWLSFSESSEKMLVSSQLILKSYLSSNFFFFGLTVLILFYFLCFIMMINQMKTSMRSMF